MTVTKEKVNGHPGFGHYLLMAVMSSDVNFVYKMSIFESFWGMHQGRLGLWGDDSTDERFFTR